MSPRDLRVLFVTAPADAAPGLVRALVEERLVACGNILPGARSMYRWEGQVCDEEEAVLWMETWADRLPVAMARVAELHPYACPKVVALGPEAVFAPYAQWAMAETRPE